MEKKNTKKGRKIMEKKNTKKGRKSMPLLDDLDYKILILTQNKFMGLLELGREFGDMKHKNIKQHLWKLHLAGLIDAVKYKRKYYFTCYYALTGDQNEWGFHQDTRTPFQLLDELKNVILHMEMQKDFDKYLKEEDEEPELPKKKMKFVPKKSRIKKPKR